MLGSTGSGLSVQNIYPAGLLWALVLNHVDGWKGASLSEPRNSSWVEGVCKHRREQRSPWGAIPKAPLPAGGRLDSAPTVSSLLLPVGLLHPYGGSTVPVSPRASFSSFLKGRPPCPEAAMAPQVPGGLHTACTPGFSLLLFQEAPRGTLCVAPCHLLTWSLSSSDPQGVVGA